MGTAYSTDPVMACMVRPAGGVRVIFTSSCGKREVESEWMAETEVARTLAQYRTMILRRGWTALFETKTGAVTCPGLRAAEGGVSSSDRIMPAAGPAHTQGVPSCLAETTTL